MKFCKCNLDSRNFVDRMSINRNSSSIIFNCSRTIFVYRNIYFLAGSCKSFINRIVNCFIN